MILQMQFQDSIGKRKKRFRYVIFFFLLRREVTVVQFWCECGASLWDVGGRRRWRHHFLGCCSSSILRWIVHVEFKTRRDRTVVVLLLTFLWFLICFFIIGLCSVYLFYSSERGKKDDDIDVAKKHVSKLINIRRVSIDLGAFLLVNFCRYSS